MLLASSEILTIYSVRPECTDVLDRTALLLRYPDEPGSSRVWISIPFPRLNGAARWILDIACSGIGSTQEFSRGYAKGVVLSWLSGFWRLQASF